MSRETWVIMKTPFSISFHSYLLNSCCCWGRVGRQVLRLLWNFMRAETWYCFLLWSYNSNNDTVGTQQIFEWMNIVYPNFLNKRGRNIYTSRCHLLSWRVFVLLASESQLSNGWAPLVSIMSKSVHDRRSCLYTIRIWGERMIIWTLKIGNVTSSFSHPWVYMDFYRAESPQCCSFKFCSSWSF